MGQTILEEAAEITAKERRKNYDHPTPNHERIKTLWNAYLSIRKDPKAKISKEDVVKMMILVKLARDAWMPLRDNLVDICGYTRLLEVMREDTDTKDLTGVVTYGC